MLRPWRRSIIWINILNVLASIFAVFSLIAALPLLEIVFSPTESISEIAVQDSPQLHADGQEQTKHWFNDTQQVIEGTIQNYKNQVYGQFQANPVESLYYLVVIILFAALLRILFLSAANLMMAKVETQFIQKLTYDLYRHIIYHDRIFFSWFPLGKLLARISMDMLKLRTLIELVYISKIQYPFQAVLLFITLLIVSPKLALFSMIFIPVIIIPAVILSKKVKKLAGREVGFDAGMMEILEEQFSGQQLIKSMKGEKVEESRFEQLAEETFERRRKRTYLVAMNQPLQELLITIAVAMIIMFGIYLVFDKSIVRGDIFLYFLVLLAALYGTIKNILDINVKIQKPLMSAGAIFKTLDAKQKTDNSERIQPFPKDWATIQINRVSFKYSSKKNIPLVLNNASLRIRKNECVLMHGKNGSGKSSLAALLAGFYFPEKGTITIDDINISRIDFDDYRNYIGYIHQEAIIFNLSVAQNIAFGIPEDEIDYKKLESIVKELDVQNFIETLPEGFNTICGPRGSKLSGGQRQLLAFCRALYFDYPILIVDEPTNSLDEKTEGHVFEILKKLKKDKTILLISHNKSLHNLADRKLYIHDGRVSARELETINFDQ